MQTTRGMLRALAYATAVALCAAAHGQAPSGGFDPARLLAPAKDSWPTFHGEYSGRRHSELEEITPDNVHTLALAWAFQTNQAQQIKATPILVDGILYLTTPDNLWAIDARSGRQIWRHQHPANDAFHIGHRGAAVYGRLSLPHHTRRASDCARPLQRQGAVGCRDRGLGPRLLVDECTTRHSQPSDRGSVRRLRQPARHSASRSIRRPAHRSGPSTARRAMGTPGSISGGATGGQMWMTGTYDPALNLLYVGTGNPTPVLNGHGRPGDNKLDVQHPRSESRYGRACVGISSVAARHARLGCGRSAGACRCQTRRRGPQAAAAGLAQRLLRGARPHDRQKLA